jgi:type II secretory pathway pseudopilin PulG
MVRKGLTLVEVLVAVSCVGLLSGIMLPSLSSARDSARRAACASQMHQIGVATSNYAAVHRFCMPPFQFCDARGTLPASGHYGGPSQPDPMTLRNPRPVNLWCPVAEHMLTSAHLICPAAPGELRGGQESLFTYTRQFSTYCLRFPPSPDLFDESPQLGYFGNRGLLGVYLMYAGGDAAQIPSPRGGAGTTYQTVPLVRLNRRYALDPDVCFGASTFDPAADAVVSDEFWWQDRHEQAPSPPPGVKAYAIRAKWSHGPFFNVLSGGGAVRATSDDGTVAANSVPPGGSPVDGGLYFGKDSERVWQYFDKASAR